jgi:trans-aconitate methyltransferase
VPTKNNKGLYDTNEKTPYTDTVFEIKETFKFAGLLAQDHFSNNPISSLDVGCANGVLSNYLSRLFPKTKFVGIDVTPQFISEAQKLTGPNLKFINTSLVSFYNDCVLKKLKFDLVTCIGTIGMWDDPYEAIKRLIELTNKSSLLIIEGNFNFDNYDVKIEYRKNSEVETEPWNIGLNQISVEATSKILNQMPLNYEFVKMPFSKNVVKVKNYSTPRWYTDDDSKDSQDRYLVNDLGMRMKHTFLKIVTR